MPDPDSAPEGLRASYRRAAHRVGIEEAFDQAMRIGIVPVLVGLAVPLWQLYSYARFGTWTSVSITGLLGWAGCGWGRWPTDWLGLHHILALIPASLGLVVLGLASGWAWYHILKWMLNQKYGSGERR
jgi:hypothetical protein